jgi:lipopolysaccharide/colanic/teichoic acid biosynthesis glycosyltransferase
MMAKRMFDWLASTCGLLVLAPAFMFIAAWIKLDSPGPVFFRQDRVGLGGQLFRIHKFRTMVTDAERGGLQITVGIDVRITRAGTFLRKYKIDELPQLIDVWLGYMSLVGPRPEVPYYVTYYPTYLQEIIQSVRPGITDNASIHFKDESVMLSKFEDPHQAYIDEILPIKLAYYAEYVKCRSFWGDINLIIKTIKNILI